MTAAAAPRCLFIVLAAAVAVLAASAEVAREARAQERPASTAPALPRPTTSSSPFTFVDVFIDPQGKPLAAYQFELRVPSGDAKLVGIEGGEHAAFAHPPYYDPKALLNDRVVIAAFNTAPADRLPSGKTRVVRLMVRAGEGAKPTFDLKLQVAASADAKPLEAVISISEGAAR